jgi:hypothetical protein
MADTVVHECSCPLCLTGEDHPDQLRHAQLNLLMSRLDEQQRRWLAALESQALGYGGDAAVAAMTGLHVDTIRRGREELAAGLRGRPIDRVRLPGAGRPAKKKIRPSSAT